MSLESSNQNLSPTSADDSAAAWQREARDEFRSWALLAVSSLGIAGAIALMLAISRIPGSETIVPWPTDFFAKGLIIHVVFSLVVWFLTVFALLASVATVELSGDPESKTRPQFFGLGRTGHWLVALAIPFLFVPAFLDGSIASLNNYVPAIVHPFYYAGLILFAVGILLPVVRLFLNLGSDWAKLGVLPVAMVFGGVIYLIALSCFALALFQVWGTGPAKAFNEQLFWGGGHVLQFLNCLMLVAGWFLLLRKSIGHDAIDVAMFRMAIGIIVIFTLPAPLMYLADSPDSALHQEFFRKLQFILALPTLMIAGGGLSSILAKRSQGTLPWCDPAFLSVVLSMAVFAAGGVMGLLIDGADTRTPAHYHGVIAAVNLSCMGLFICYLLPAMRRRVGRVSQSLWSLGLFGCGQLLACIGLFMAGGYGAPRKVPGRDVMLFDEAIFGLYLNGIGALIAVIGGVMFVVMVVQALWREEDAPGG